MHCFQVADTIAAGLLVTRRRYEEVPPYRVPTSVNVDPHIVTPPGCALQVLLDPELAEDEDVRAAPPGNLYLTAADLKYKQGSLVLTRARLKGERQALVRIETAGGVFGKAFVTSNTYDENMERGHVRRVYHPFPSVGVQALCTPEELARIRNGLEFVDVLVLMQPGSSFRIKRTGKLEGAAPWMSVKWDINERTQELELTSHVPERFRRHQERNRPFNWGGAPGKGKSQGFEAAEPLAAE